MTTYDNGVVQLHTGDSRHLPLADGTVSVVCTSPPYLGLRAYAGDQELVWDAEEGCHHEWAANLVSAANDSNRGDMNGTTGGAPGAKVLGAKVSQGTFCSLCLAWKGAFGLEPSPSAYIRHLMVFMAELWRVLRDDGCVFVNLGDSYNSAGPNNHGKSTLVRLGSNAETWHQPSTKKLAGIRPKSLMLIPERFAIACQEAGWIVRSRIAWAKPNPMPESVRDRPTDSWEHIWMLTKSERYYFDQEAVREPLAESTLADGRNGTGRHPQGKYSSKYESPSWYREQGKVFVNPEQGRNLRSVWTIADENDKIAAWFGKLGFCRKCNGLRVAGNGLGPTIARDMGGLQEIIEQNQENFVHTESRMNSLSAQSPQGLQLTMFAETEDVSTRLILNPSLLEPTSCEVTHQPPTMPPSPTAQPDMSMMYPILISEVMVNGSVVPVCACDAEDNALKSVWRIPTQSFEGAHFATFPEALVEPCILAACPEDICTVCNTPRVRMVEHANMEWTKGPKRMADAALGRTRMGGTQNVPASNKTLGFTDCGHGSYVPGLVLDPFSGSGTTALVAQKLGRRAIGVDLSEEYTAMAAKRIGEVPLPLILSPAKVSSDLANRKESYK